ncbi:spore germination protein [Halobacillus salinarum]|uniref:Spore germination protein n=1 Tax=Halobacillus salinarum TaxID=2932257 RepID=A0ABY4ELT1_9BACI|nr:spore germination protein [Halobacillus salinarum]UOQ45088.1 spore germination protein [Halobacillus salinarum]
MPSINNIYNIKVNSISHNGSVNIGDALHNSPTANSKATGQNTSYGDAAPASAGMENVYIDPDVEDQGQSGNSADVNATQQ